MADHADRKRQRADNDETPRKSKKPKEAKKRTGDDSAVTDAEQDVKHRYDEASQETTASGDETGKKSKKSKKDKREKKDKKDKKEKKDKKDKKSRDHSATKSTPTGLHSTSEPIFPFYTQTVSLWVPLYPAGFDRPISSAAHQHLDTLVNRYSPLLGGYLLAYRNVNLSEASVRADPSNPPTDETPTTLASVDEYAVGFAWITADVDLFVPSRGAWLEGNVILQNEGAIGVICWGTFNASIEAPRVPLGWQYVNLDSTLHDQREPELEIPQATEMAQAETDRAEGESMDVSQLAAAPPFQETGYWVDENGRPVEGNIRFRVKNFDFGLEGDRAYLAIEGTMLSIGEERELAQQEREKARQGSNRTGKSRRLPEFSITQFGKEEEEEESGQRVELYKGSRPGTPDD